MVNNHKTPVKDPNGIIIKDDVSGEWKIQLMQISLISSLDTQEICIMDSKSDNAEIMMGNKTYEYIKEIFEIFKKKI